MAEQLITAATVYRKKKGAAEWLVFKSGPKEPGEFPKGPVMRGESSVGAILRILREEKGLTVEVKEETGRATFSSSKSGQKTTEKILYYLIESSEENNGLGTDKEPEEKWGQYAQISKILGSERERKMLSQARDLLKELLKVKKA